MRFLLVHYVDEEVEFNADELADQDAALASWAEETSQVGSRSRATAFSQSVTPLLSAFVTAR